MTTPSAHSLDEAKRVPLGNDLYAIVDADWFEMLMLVKWHSSKSHNKTKKQRAMTSLSFRGLGSSEFMHRVIMDAPKQMEVDHINGDALDNRRCNLRLCTSSQNKANTKKYSRLGKTLKYKGTCENRYGGWETSITYKGQKKYLGTFKTAEEGARAYDAAAIVIYGEFASLNLPPTEPRT